MAVAIIPILKYSLLFCMSLLFTLRT